MSATLTELPSFPRFRKATHISLAHKIRDQNDVFRVAKLTGKHTDLKGQVVFTQGVDALSDSDKQAVFQQVREFSYFSEDNDPYREHDFGAFTHGGDEFFWKIDYYAADLMHGSENPADPA